MNRVSPSSETRCDSRDPFFPVGESFYEGTGMPTPLYLLRAPSPSPAEIARTVSGPARIAKKPPKEESHILYNPVPVSSGLSVSPPPLKPEDGVIAKTYRTAFEIFAKDNKEPDLALATAKDDFTFTIGKETAEWETSDESDGLSPNTEDNFMLFEMSPER